MPILKFSCKDCGKEFPKIIISVDSMPQKCIVCGSQNLEERGDAFEKTQDALSRYFCDSCDTCDTCGESCST